MLLVGGQDLGCEDKDVLYRRQTLGGMNAAESGSRPYQTTTLSKWMFFQKIFFKTSLLLNG